MQVLVLTLLLFESPKELLLFIAQQPKIIPHFLAGVSRKFEKSGV